MNLSDIVRKHYDSAAYIGAALHVADSTRVALLEHFKAETDPFKSVWMMPQVFGIPIFLNDTLPHLAWKLVDREGNILHEGSLDVPKPPTNNLPTPCPAVDWANVEMEVHIGVKICPWQWETMDIAMKQATVHHCELYQSHSADCECSCRAVKE